MPYRYSREITEQEQEVLAMLVRGNHKSTKEEPEIVEKLLTKDVVHGFFSMVIPIELVPLIPNAMVQPVGLAKQWTLDDQANVYDASALLGLIVERSSFDATFAP